MSEAQAALLLSALRAFAPLVLALLSLLAVPLVSALRFGGPLQAATRARYIVVALLLLSGGSAFIAGAGVTSTLSIGDLTINPSQPGRLLVALGGPIFAIIVAVGEGRRAGAMGQVALFGLAVIDLALAIPIGLAPITLLLIGGTSLAALAAGGKEDAERARAVFRDLRSAGVLITLTVIAELLRASIPLSATDPAYATTASLTAGVALALSLIVLACVGAFPFHHRLVRIFDSLPIVGSLMVGVWIPAAITLIIFSELSLLISAVNEPMGGAVLPILVATGAFTMLFGGVSALLHDDVGEVLGFFAVGSSGWLVLGLAAVISRPSTLAPHELVIPATLAISLFGLWRAAVRRRYDLVSLQELTGWARHTSAIGFVLIGVAAALVALPGSELWTARAEVIGAGGNVIAIVAALAGAVALFASILRVLLVGLAQKSRAVQRTEVRRATHPITIAMLAGTILIAGTATGVIDVESAASELLRPAPEATSVPGELP
ncbi:MAG: proton-conducting transporter membrane subunit [Candidatus Limnocylindrus sp.]|jgi:NADH:ubiquinone oxidoreductase subunit 2 (subunit N)